MTLSEFKRLYNPLTRCYVKSKPRKGAYHLEGVIIDVQGEINKDARVYVDNFFNRMSIEEIDSMTVTNSAWRT